MCGFASLVLIALVLFQDGHSQLLDDDCGGPKMITFRIAGGRLAPINTAPFMAGLYNDTEIFCGGSLIHKRYVLTAAHCVRGQEEVTLRLGEHDRSCSPAMCPHVQRYTAKVIIHPGFKNDSLLDDIALLRLDRDVAYNENIRPACIILDEDVTSDEVYKFSVFGWGKTEHNVSSQILKTVDLDRLGPNQCYSSRNIICAGSMLGDTCGGDSGSPLGSNTTYRGKDLYVQYGFLSYGSTDCKGFGAYVDVNAYRLWIANTVLETEQRLLTEKCKSDWGGNVLIRLWEMSLFEHNFSGALITNQFVLTVASAFPSNITKIKVESTYLSTYDVEWFHIHPSFKSSPIQNNIAVIKLTGKLPKSDLEAPICMGLNLSPPMTWNAYLYGLDANVLGVQSVDLKRIDNCSAKIKLPVERDQFCIEKPDQLMYAPYETPGSVIGTKQTFEGTERYLIAALISHTQGNVIVLTNIHEHQKWIANVLKI
ncbi:ovochymase-2 isoform X2 [Drosophila subpulchrella]|uniref:ovochymase-2 isoform X2 n=1 Tax=Drosophila subpulchrella TaxID=1486046 RepID=UPI0018A1A03D|nr:ovochymase-2 isoform X2 [Drosophila subpulchrella]